MKNTTFLLPWLSLFYFLISLSSFAADAASSPPVVLDLDRNPLRAGVSYFILPVIRGQGGGVTLLSTNTGNKTRKTCPFVQIIQHPLDGDTGIQLAFSPVNSTESGVVPESTDLNIKFSEITLCNQSYVWRIGKYDEAYKVYFLTTGGVEGNPGKETIRNWFKIEKSGDGYKLVFCPTVCKFCKVICKDVGTSVVNGYRRLALTDDQPFLITFKKG